MRKTIIEHVAEYAVCQSDKVAVVAKEIETSYGELFRLVRGYSRFLRESGVKKGDIVVVKASQSLEYVVIYLAIHLCGAVVSSAEKSVSEDGLKGIATKLAANVIIADEFEMKDVIFLSPKNILETANEYFVEDYEYEFPDLEDSADILFTTGTTGASKGVELSHKALVATAENLIYGCGYKRDTVLIVPGPLNHANAIRKVFTTLINGSTVYILNGMLSINAFYKALDYEKGTIACCLPPSAVRRIFQITEDKLGEYADKIDFIESASSPLPEPDKQRLCRLLPNTRLFNNYGSSESASVCMYDYNKNPGLVGCIGKAMPNSEIIVVDENRQIIKSSKEQMGYIACKGDVNMKGYVNDPETTKEVLIDGIVYTNDIGYIDENGFIYISGRKGDVINVGGLKVAPTEVESVALEYDGIGECICIGVDDETSGKALKFLYVLNKNAEFNLKEFRKFLTKKLESYKVPSYYEEVEEIAKTYNGKIDRKHYL